jgi:hypothetical protein
MLTPRRATLTVVHPRPWPLSRLAHWLLLGLAGCPSPSSAAPASDAQPPPACTHVGQTCEYAPNKLGSCVQRDNCTQDCLVCQSQH